MKNQKMKSIFSTYFNNNKPIKINFNTKDVEKKRTPRRQSIQNQLSLLIFICTKILVAYSLYLMAEVLEKFDLFQIDKHNPPTGIFGRLSRTMQTLAIIKIAMGLVHLVCNVPYRYLTTNMFTEDKNNGSLNVPKSHSSNMNKKFVFLILIAYLSGHTLIQVFWIFGLQLSSPFAVLLLSQYDYVMVNLLSGTSKIQIYSGRIFYFCGLMALVLKDFNSERQFFGIISNNLLGILTLIISALIKTFLNFNWKNLLVNDFGSDANLELLLATINVLVFGSLLVIDLIASADLINFGIIPIILALSLAFEFYSETFAFEKFKIQKVIVVGSITSYTSAIALNFFYSKTNLLNNFIVFGFFLIGVIILSRRPETKSFIKLKMDNNLRKMNETKLNIP